MAESILLTIARESILEVFEAKRRIDIDALTAQEPLLNTPHALCVTLFTQEEILGSSGTTKANGRLIESLIYHAKVAAFEDTKSRPITTSQYLHAKIDLALISDVTPLYPPTFESFLHVREQNRGVYCKSEGLFLLPYFEIDLDGIEKMFMEMATTEIYSFHVEHAYDKAIL